MMRSIISLEPIHLRNVELPLFEDIRIEILCLRLDDIIKCKPVHAELARSKLSKIVVHFPFY